MLMPIWRISSPLTRFMRSQSATEPAAWKAIAAGIGVTPCSMRITMPPSWSMEMSSGVSETSALISCSSRHSADTCAGVCTLRRNRITPPTFFCRIRALIWSFACRASKPTMNNCPTFSRNPCSITAPPSVFYAADDECDVMSVLPVAQAQQLLAQRTQLRHMILFLLPLAGIAVQAVAFGRQPLAPRADAPVAQGGIVGLRGHHGNVLCQPDLVFRRILPYAVTQLAIEDQQIAFLQRHADFFQRCHVGTVPVPVCGLLAPPCLVVAEQFRDADEAAHFLIRLVADGQHALHILRIRIGIIIPVHEALEF